MPWLKPAWLRREAERLGPALYAQEYGADFLAASLGFFSVADLRRAITPGLKSLQLNLERTP